MVYINFGKRDKKTAPRRFLGHPEAVLRPLPQLWEKRLGAKGFGRDLPPWIFYSIPRLRKWELILRQL